MSPSGAASTWVRYIRSTIPASSAAAYSCPPPMTNASSAPPAAAWATASGNPETTAAPGASDNAFRVTTTLSRPGNGRTEAGNDS